MIYIDTSVVLAGVLGEDRAPLDEFWQQSLVSSSLLLYEVWNRLHARQLQDTYGPEIDTLLARMVLIELAAPVLERALRPFPVAVRTLDSLHPATACWLQDQGSVIRFATYDRRLAAAASAVGLREAPGL